MNAQVTDLPGVPGQGTTNPQSIFDNHVLVLFKGVYYDPSYGKSYNSLADFEDRAVVGFVKGKKLVESDVNLDLDHNGMVEENKEVRVFLFAQNPRATNLTDLNHKPE